MFWGAKSIHAHQRTLLREDVHNDLVKNDDGSFTQVLRSVTVNHNIGVLRNTGSFVTCTI